MFTSFHMLALSFYFFPFTFLVAGLSLETNTYISRLVVDRIFTFVCRIIIIMCLLK